MALLEIALLAALFGYIYVNYVLLIISNIVPRKVPANKMQRFPLVSVIIATKNEEAVIGETLRRLKRSRYKGPYEIIVVDGNSTDQTRASARRYGARVLVEKKPRGKPAALNFAIKHARGELLFFLDADSLVAKDTLRLLVESVSGDYAAAAGRVVGKTERGAISRLFRLEEFFSDAMENGIFRMINTGMLFGRNFVIRKNALIKIEGFKDALTEDINLSYRLYKAGYKACYIDNACMEEQSPSKVRDYWKQQQRWIAGGLDELVNSIRRAKITEIFIEIPAMAFRFSMPAVFPLLLTVYYFTQSAHALWAALFTAFAYLVSTARYLDRKDLAMFPITFVLFGAAELALIADAVTRKIFHRKVGWVKTPKHRY